MTTLASPSALDSAFSSLATALASTGRDVVANPVAGLLVAAQCQLGLAKARYSPHLRFISSAATSATADAAALTTAAGELTGGNATAATAAAAVATAQATACTTYVAAHYALGGEVALIAPWLSSAATQLASGAAYTAVAAAQSTLSGLFS